MAVFPWYQCWDPLNFMAVFPQPLLKSPAPPLLHVAALGQKQGILGAQPQLIFQPHRIPPLFPQKREYWWHACWGVTVWGTFEERTCYFNIDAPGTEGVTLGHRKRRRKLDGVLGLLSHQPFPFFSPESLPDIPHTSPEPPEQVSCPGSSWQTGPEPQVRELTGGVEAPFHSSRSHVHL